MTFQDLNRITSVSSFLSKINFGDDYIEFPAKLRYSEGEWEYYISKLHGKYLSSSKEDLETIKKLVEKL